MTNYVLFLRSVNVGGRNKVSMAILKNQLETHGFKNPMTYINSGNILLSSDFTTETETSEVIKSIFEQFYDFAIPFALISFEDYLKQFDSLPEWWNNEDHYRRNVLFYLPEVAGMVSIDEDALTESESIHAGDLALFWVVGDKEEYSQTQYVRLIKNPLYKKVTIRNANTFNKIAKIIKDFPKE